MGAPTPEAAARKYDAKADVMGRRWEGKKGQMVANWPTGIQGFYGVTPGPISSEAYRSGLGAISGTDFSTKVRGKGSKMMENARAGLAL